MKTDSRFIRIDVEYPTILGYGRPSLHTADILRNLLEREGYKIILIRDSPTIVQLNDPVFDSMVNNNED